MVEFRPVAWQPDDDLSMDKLNQMNQNDQYLFDNTANMVYRDVSRIRTTTGLKLIAGVVTIGVGLGQSKSVNVDYAGEYDTGIAPIITTGLIVTNSNEHDSSLTIRGRGTTLPNDAGFQFRWEMRKNLVENQCVKGTLYCHYMALGVSSRVMAAPE